jgi:hypothetical protein
VGASYLESASTSCLLDDQVTASGSGVLRTLETDGARRLKLIERLDLVQQLNIHDSKDHERYCLHDIRCLITLHRCVSRTCCFSSSSIADTTSTSVGFLAESSALLAPAPNINYAQSDFTGFEYL